VVGLKIFEFIEILVPAVLVAACAQPLLAVICALSTPPARREAKSGAHLWRRRRAVHAFWTVQVEGREVPIHPASTWIVRSRKRRRLQFNERFGLQFILPVVYRSFKRLMAKAHRPRTESGIGDASLLASFVPYRILAENFTFNWSVLAGVKFPTGTTDRIKEEFNEVENPVGPPVAYTDTTLPWDRFL